MACDRFNAVLPVTTSITPIHLASVYLKHSKTRRGDHLWRVAAHPASGLVGFLRAQLRTAWKACAAITDSTTAARVPTCLDPCTSQLLEIETFVLLKNEVRPLSASSGVPNIKRWSCEQYALLRTGTERPTLRLLASGQQCCQRPGFCGCWWLIQPFSRVTVGDALLTVLRDTARALCVRSG